MLKGMRGQMRCCTATIGDAAAADAELYPNLYSTILIWIGAAGCRRCQQQKQNPSAARLVAHWWG